MKKIIIVIALLIGAVTVHAQTSEILFNSQEPTTGLNCMGTSDIIVRNGFTDRHPLKISILAVETSKGWTYSLEVAVCELISSAVPEGGVLLIRTKNDEVIELTNRLSETQSTDFVGQWIEGTASKTYYNKGSYSVTREQLEMIAGGVQKIRMQIGSGVFDTEYKKDRMGAAVAAHLAAIDAAEAKDIRADF